MSSGRRTASALQGRRALRGREGLAAAAALAERGVRLLVDFVPNHVAPDHPWARRAPGVLRRRAAPTTSPTAGGFLAVGDAVIARGRDPFFPPWPDVAQLDAFAPGCAAAPTRLIDIGDQADGVRCDMAMLLLNDVFARTWGDARPRPAQEYWTEVIGAVRRRTPTSSSSPRPTGTSSGSCSSSASTSATTSGCTTGCSTRPRVGAGHLGRPRLPAPPRALPREPRRAAPRPSCPGRAAAAVAIATLPGATLWHEGQFEGWRVRLPVFLGRRPEEPIDADLVPSTCSCSIAQGLRRGRVGTLRADRLARQPSCDQLLVVGPTMIGDRSS